MSLGSIEVVFGQAGALELVGDTFPVVAGGGGGGGVTDHGALTGLGDDDHSQYHTDARADARYYQKSQVDSALAGKADAAHSHAVDDVTGLQSALDGKQPAAAVLTNTTASFTTTLEAKLSGVAVGAEVNQNAFSNIAVSGQSTVAADAKTDTLTLVAGANVTITTDAGTDSVTISSTGGGGGVTDHGALTGLGDDDHTQYHTDARGDARYYTKAQVDSALAGKSDTGHGHANASAGAAGFMAAADKTKLDGIASGATANSSDATLLARANHTGTQAISTVTGLQAALDGKQAIGSGQRTVHDLGTISSGTMTPEPATGDMKKCVNNGAFTLAGPTQTGAYVLRITNGASAGAITLSGLTTIVGSATYATTNGKIFDFVVDNFGSGTPRVQIVEIA